MTGRLILRCVNCGSPLGTPPEDAVSIRCPVCQFDNPVFAAARGPALTADMLARSVGELVARARNSGVSAEVIVDMLRDELQFAAELAHAGRQLHVQILDLGPAEGQFASAPAAPLRDRTAVLRGRAVGE